MSGDGEDLRAEGLDLITRGINLTLGELKELDPLGRAAMGRGFADIGLSGLQLGHEEITSAFTSFCERWEWGVRALVHEGNYFAAGVGLAAGTLHETDQYVEGTLKIGANAVMGNPHATEDEITRMSWDELGDNHALADADYSKESFERAWDNSKQGWLNAGRDVLTSDVMPPGALGVRPEGMTEEQYEALLDESLGPSPEEQERAAREDGGSGR